MTSDQGLPVDRGTIDASYRQVIAAAEGTEAASGHEL